MWLCFYSPVTMVSLMSNEDKHLQICLEIKGNRCSLVSKVIQVIAVCTTMIRAQTGTANAECLHGADWPKCRKKYRIKQTRFECSPQLIGWLHGNIIFPLYITQGMMETLSKLKMQSTQMKLSKTKTISEKPLKTRFFLCFTLLIHFYITTDQNVPKTWFLYT